jgi:hypothetical protein
MKTRVKIAFAIYLVGCLSLIGFGVAYLLCSTVMPYHQQAIGTNWEQLSTGMQVLLQALIKAAGVGFLAVGINGLILLFIPFRRWERWAYWAIPIPAFLWNGLSLYITAKVAIATGASTPWAGSIIGLIMIAVAFILSISTGGKQKEAG